MTNSMSKRWASDSKPVAVIIDLSEVFLILSPNHRRQPGDLGLERMPHPILQVLQRFTIHDIIEAIFTFRADSIDQESAVWHSIEYKCPELFDIFNDDANNYMAFELLVDSITGVTDEVIRKSLTRFDLEDIYSDYQFDRWVGHSTAILVYSSLPKF